MTRFDDTESDNAEISVARFPALTALSFQRVDPQYRQQLRLSLLPWMLLTLPLWFFLDTALANWPGYVRLAVAGLPALLILLLLLFWVPRRYRHTGYCVREHDLHLRTGALFQQTLSITLNRIQHMELTRGPLERLLGLSSLAIYTAGGSGRDLAIPGLDTTTAERLREYLLERIRTRRDTPDEPAPDSPTAPHADT